MGNTNIQATTVENVGYRRRFYRRYGYPVPYAYYPPAYGYYGPPSAYAYPPAIGHYPPPDGNYADAPSPHGDYAGAPSPDGEYADAPPPDEQLRARSTSGKVLIEQEVGLAASLFLALS